jgi:glycosyltransferase involved in cell wall biosynthesis
MKILYFSRNYTPHDYRFLSSLSKTEHEIFYLKLEANQRQTEDRSVPENVQQILWAGGQREFRWSDLPRLMFDFRRVVKRIKPDISHRTDTTCAFITIDGFIPFCVVGIWLVMDADECMDEWVHDYLTQCFFTSDANVTREKAVAFGMNPEKTVIFPWGTDIDISSKLTGNGKQCQNRKSSIAIEDHSPMCPGTIYGVDVLAKAFVKVASVNLDVNLVLLGGGSQGAKIRQILMNGGVMERVHFGGQVGQRDLPRWYHMADIYISPSHVDGSSVTLMEALASGLPCLVSDIAGNKEWIEDGVNGWLFRDGDVDDLAEKILSAIKKRREFKRIGELARKTAEERADWKKNFGKLLEAYNVIARSER